MRMIYQRFSCLLATLSLVALIGAGCAVYRRDAKPVPRSRIETPVPLPPADAGQLQTDRSPASNSILSETSGGPVDYLTNEAQRALVYVEVYVKDQERPLPGTAFVIARRGGKAYLLTAWHVLNPGGGRRQVKHVRLRGGGVVECDTEHVQQLVVASRREDDIALLYVDADPRGAYLQLGHADAELGGVGAVLALGYANSEDQGPLPAVTKRPGTISTSTTDKRPALSTNADLLPGMSGGPVIQTGTGLVIGVVRGRDENPASADLQGLVAPVWILATELKQQVDLDLRRQRAPYGLDRLPSPLIERFEEKQVNALLGAVSAPPPFVLLFGTAGMGKTVLANQVAWGGLRRGQYPDGVFLIHVNDHPVAQVLSDLSSAILRRPLAGEPTEVAAQLNGVLRGKRVLVILDDLRSETLPAELMQAMAETAVVATSRLRYADPRVQPVEVGSLPPQQAQELLRAMLRDNWHREIDPPMVELLCQKLGHHVLAVSLAAGVMGMLQLSPATFLERLKEEPLSALDSATGPERSVRASLNLSLQALRPAEELILTVLGLLAEAPLQTSSLRSILFGQSIDAALDRFVRISLLHRIGEDEVGMHPLVYLWARERAEKHVDAPYIRAKLIEWFIKHGPGEYVPLFWRPSLAQHVLAMQNGAARTGQTKVVLSLAEAWSPTLGRLGPWSARTQLWRTVVATLRGSQQRADLADAWANLGFALGRDKSKEARECFKESLAISRQIEPSNVLMMRLQRIASEEGRSPFAKSLLEESLQIARRLKDRPSIARALQRLGDASDETTRMKLWEESAAILRELHDFSAVARALRVVGRIARDKGNLTKAREVLQESLSLYRKLEDNGSIVDCLLELSGVAHSAHDTRTARTQLQESVTIALQTKQFPEGLTTFYELAGHEARSQGELEIARELWVKSLAIYSVLGYRNPQIRVGLDLTNLLNRFGDYPAAEGMARATLTVARKLENHREIVSSLFYLASFAKRQHNIELEKSLLEEALGIARDLDDSSEIVAILLIQLGGAAWRSGDLSTARKYQQEGQQVINLVPKRLPALIAIALAEQAGLAAVSSEAAEADRLFQRSLTQVPTGTDERSKKFRADHLRYLAEIQQDAGKLLMAEKLLQNCLTLCREVKDRACSAGALEQLGLLRRDAGDLKGARIQLGKSLPLWRELEYPPAAARILNELGALAEKSGDNTKAHRYYEQARELLPRPSRQ